MFRGGGFRSPFDASTFEISRGGSQVRPVDQLSPTQGVWSFGHVNVTGLGRGVYTGVQNDTLQFPLITVRLNTEIYKVSIVLTTLKTNKQTL